MRQHHYKKREKEPAELPVTTFLNLMVVLVPFLLITAVFSRIAIVELTLPSNNGGAAATPPTFRVEVVVREDGMEITNGRQVIASIPKVNGDFDFDKLSDYMVELKREYPDTTDASVLLEPQISYDYLIRVMDVVRSRDIEDQTPEGFTRVALFTDIAVGEAP